MTFTPAARNAAEYQERAHDELKQLELHPSDTGSIKLDSFMAMAQDERRAVWALASDDDRRGLALQIIRRKNHGPDEATIALYLEQLEVRFGSDVLLPTAAEILASAKERADTARQFGDVGGARQLDRVRMNIDRGARLTWHLGDLLIQSVNNPGAVYSVNGRGCTCPNGAAGKQQCWHTGLYDLLVEMAEDRAAARDILADAAAYRAEQEQAEDGGDDTPPTPITLTQTPDGLVLTHGAASSVARDPSDLARAIDALTGYPVATPAQLGQRLADARRRYLVAA